MDSLQLLKKQILDLFSSDFPISATHQFQQIQCQINATNEINLLAWLKAQTNYPQFYFHRRDRQHKIVTLGELKHFNDLSAAQTFVQTYNFPLFGGIHFYGKSHFYLPQLVLEQDNSTTPQLLLRIFFDNQKDIQQQKQRLLKLVENLDQTLPLCTVQQPLVLVEQAADQEQWQQWVEQALLQIKQGSLRKVVLANKTRFMAAQTLNAKDILAESERKNLHCYHFLFAEDANNAFIGSSPERLYARQGLELQTEALAGTALITANEQQNQQQGEWLLNDKKNRFENWLVVQDISQNLLPYVNHIEQEEVGLKQLRQVQHLYCPIRAQLKTTSQDKDCLNAIHPSAAVSGFDRQQAKQFLQQTENFERGWYAGTLGFMSQQQADFCVAIRSALITENTIQAFAGAGIVEGSEPLAEWQEIKRKALGLLSLLAEKYELENKYV